MRLCTSTPAQAVTQPTRSSLQPASPSARGLQPAAPRSVAPRSVAPRSRPHAPAAARAQAVVVSGESGSGKTVSMAHVISYLTRRTGGAASSALGNPSPNPSPNPNPNPSPNPSPKPNPNTSLA